MPMKRHQNSQRREIFQRRRLWRRHLHKFKISLDEKPHKEGAEQCLSGTRRGEVSRCYREVRFVCCFEKLLSVTQIVPLYATTDSSRCNRKRALVYQQRSVTNAIWRAKKKRKNHSRKMEIENSTKQETRHL